MSNSPVHEIVPPEPHSTGADFRKAWCYMPRWFQILLLLAVIVGGILVLTLYSRHAQPVREAELKADLQTMRSAIMNYTEYEEEAPQSLEDLVRLQYLYKIPADPVCHLDWKTDFGERNLVLGLKLMKVRGLVNVFSNCPKVGSNGKSYDTW